MNIEKQGEVFRVESSRKGSFYDVDLKKSTCTCPQFRFRLRGKGECKHIKACKELSAGNCEGFDEMVAYVREHVFVESVELIEKFGEECVDSMIAQGELIEEQGKVRLL